MSGLDITRERIVAGIKAGADICVRTIADMERLAKADPEFADMWLRRAEEAEGRLITYRAILAEAGPAGEHLTIGGEPA